MIDDEGHEGMVGLLLPQQLTDVHRKAKVPVKLPGSAPLAEPACAGALGAVGATADPFAL